MQGIRRRIDALREYLRTSMWLLPALAVIGSFVLGAVLVRIDVSIEKLPLGWMIFHGEAAGARAILQVLIGSIITVTSLVFSLTLVALQLSASAYSPRILRRMVRDRTPRVVLAIFLGTFTYSYSVLRSIGNGGSGGSATAPALAMAVLLFFVFASLGALVFFIHHVTRMTRVETIMENVERDTLAIARTNLQPEQGDDRPPSVAPPPGCRPILSKDSGEVQAYSAQDVVGILAERDLVLRYRAVVGESVLAGTPMAHLWRRDGRACEVPDDRLCEAVQRGIQLGAERTMQQDVAYGIRQLVDIALRAISPGVNDPTTATESIRRIAVVLAEIATSPLDDIAYRDREGNVRVVVPRLSFERYLDLACTQIRIYGARDPFVMSAVIAMLDDVAMVAPDDRKPAVLEQIARIVDAAERGVESEADRRAVRERAEEATGRWSGGARIGPARERSWGGGSNP